ncbi:Cysteine-rich receptor-like protein kinase 29 [Platanthera guangdongensis]|uniref:Cysteine-rich receptor-like protein kinase 29 n=1 Tax=Platanthera guangdongensis TaxID=2320717 RepID=A0ABR2M1P2_9ASPA
MYPRFSENLLISLLIIVHLTITIVADPQINLLSVGCSNHNSTNPSLFLANLNATIYDLKSQIYTSDGRILFATAERSNSSMPVFALAFCRGYLSRQDCITCLTSAASRARICSSETGGLVIDDGCTMRYESAPLLDQSTLPVNNFVCGNETDDTAGFDDSARELLRGLSLVAPRMTGYFAAAAYAGVYAVAQCSPIVSQPVCSVCLQVAYANIKGCFSASDGRAVDAVCFMRYSNEAFFPANYTMNLAAYFPPGI